MMTTSGISRQATPGHFRQRSDELRRIVQRLRTGQGNAPLSGVPTEEDVNIVQDFYVVADEPDGIDHHVADSCCRIAIEHRLDGWSQPLVAGHPLALVSK